MSRHSVAARGRGSRRVPVLTAHVRAPLRLAVLVCLGSTMAVHLSAHSQAWVRQASVKTEVTATDSGSVSATGEKRSDLITSVQPGVRIERRSPSLDLSVDAALDFLAYARDTQPDSILPSLLARSKATLVPQALFIDASIEVRQVEEDPFGVRVEQGRNQNSRTVSSYSLNPYFLHEFSPSLSALAHLGKSLYVRPGTDAANVRTHSGVARVDLKPVPLGAFVELSRLDNEFDGVAESNVTIDAVRAGLTMTLSDNVIGGLVIGRERIRLGTTETGNIYGATLRWDPAPRTELVARFERRLYGNGGRLTFRHRTAFTALSVEVSREPVTVSAISSAGADVSGYLDAILQRSVPEPVLRATRIQNQLSSLGLRSNVPTAVDVSADYVQLLTAGKITWVLSTPRNTVTVAGYAQRARQLTISDDFVPGTSLTSDNQQIGASVEFNRRLDTQTALDVRAQWSRITGLELREGEVTREYMIRMALLRSLSPRTDATVGLEYRNLNSTVSLPSYGSTSGFVGLNHRF